MSYLDGVLQKSNIQKKQIDLNEMHELPSWKINVVATINLTFCFHLSFLFLSPFFLSFLLLLSNKTFVFIVHCWSAEKKVSTLKEMIEYFKIFKMVGKRRCTVLNSEDRFIFTCQAQAPVSQPVVLNPPLKANVIWVNVWFNEIKVI